MKLSLAQIERMHYQQTRYQWLYTWYRYKDQVYVEDQITHDRFLWIPRP